MLSESKKCSGKSDLPWEHVFGDRFWAQRALAGHDHELQQADPGLHPTQQL